MSVSGVRSPEVDSRHVARLRVIERKQDRYWYACEVVHRERGAGFTRGQVLAWLAAHGYGPAKSVPRERRSPESRVSEVLAKYRERFELEATGGGKGARRAELPAMTPELQEAIEELRDTGKVVPFPVARTSGPDVGTG